METIGFDRKKYTLERIANRKISHIIVPRKVFVNIEGEISGYLMPKISNDMHIDSIRDYRKLVLV